jgi:predicted MPP superfamily phosphohydrolase
VIPQRTSFLISIGLALSLCIYGYFEARNIQTERLVLATTKLPAGTDRLTIVQLSDVHLGLINRSGRLTPMLAAVKAAEPDILVVTGDLVDAEINHLTGLAEMFRTIEPKNGKFAIMGNHEYFAGTEKALAFIRDAGFTMLRSEAITSGPITLVGVDDRTGVQLKLRSPEPEQALFAGLARDKFILLLKHQPTIDQASLGLFDLQLSGHTHKGQLFPFTWLTRLSYPLNAGRYDLAKGSVLYVNRGTGTWGPPIRVLAPPEVTVIELVKK